MQKLYIFFQNELVRNQKIEIEIQFSPGLSNEESKVLSDALRIEQVLSNLLNNAVKYTHKGLIRFGYKLVKNKKLEFFVEDTGIGIPEEMTKHIFEPFRQVDEGFTRHYGGTGLGLPICRGILKKLDGELWVKSQKGKGSTFYFTIPYNPLKKTTTDHKKDKKIKKQTYNWQNKVILVVEDDALNFEYIKIILTPTNAGIIHASNGEETIDICKNMRLDLILMDIRMPTMNGYNATKKIREMGFDIPILAQTAHAMPGDKENLLKIGCNDYISKPLHKEILLRKIDDLLTSKTR